MMKLGGFGIPGNPRNIFYHRCWVANHNEYHQEKFRFIAFYVGKINHQIRITLNAVDCFKFQAREPTLRSVSHLRKTRFETRFGFLWMDGRNPADLGISNEVM